jgi:hypothetical protein
LLPVLFAILVLCCPHTSAVELPEFPSDQHADVWLREQSAFYRSMAEVVEQRGGYLISRNPTIPGGLAYYLEGRGHIELGDTLSGAHRVSILIFEMTNLYQEPRHREVTDRVRRGEIDHPLAFAYLRESIEYDGLRHHREVLLQLQAVLGVVPAPMITWITNDKSFATYQVPYAYDYFTAQERSGHTAHFIRLFEKHRAEYTNTLRKE